MSVEGADGRPLRPGRAVGQERVDGGRGPRSSSPSGRSPAAPWLPPLGRAVKCTIWYMPRCLSRPQGSGPGTPARRGDRALHAPTGLADQSLRRIAEAVGTSHRMLLYHFGSKDGLLLEVVREVEARTQARFGAIGEGAGGETDELVRRMWAYVADPALADFERLFFALYGRALQGDESALPLLDGRHRDTGSTPTSRCRATAGHARRGRPDPRPTGAGGHPGPAARPARHRRPRRHRRRPRGLRPPLRRALVGCSSPRERRTSDRAS